MPICPVCNELTATATLVHGVCPNCQQSSSDDASDAWRSVAKVSNLAEAGYLVSCLAGDDIEARLLESNSFSAVSGAWASSYVLQVPTLNVEAANTIIRAEAEEFDREQSEYNAFGEPIDDEPVHLVFWRPVALMAVAGLATLWLGQRVADPRPRVAPNRSAAALGTAIEAAGQPFVVTTDTGSVQHRLHYRAANHTWYLESDTDGDGRLDHRQMFVLDSADH